MTRKILLAALVAAAVGGAALAQPASAACLSNGVTIVCRPGPGPHELLNRYFKNPYGRPLYRHKSDNRQMDRNYR